jgi:hypothetical protein
MQRFVHSIKTKLKLLIDPSYWLTDTQIHQREDSNAFKLDEADKGWLLRRGVDGDWRRMCWLPYKRRKNGIIHVGFGQKVVITAWGGLMTILDFSDIPSAQHLYPM